MGLDIRFRQVTPYQKDTIPDLAKGRFSRFSMLFHTKPHVGTFQTHAPVFSRVLSI